ncbi:MAG: hypothetical protein DRJ03_24885 [Chloroflexi bacterium]|nr:MAG: hypothetical protein DRJ03_24870 [Chloroflexota bacterium]RLC78677.1 MAG: hypothetical protein DRJ03_24885 [Chloroflexota bacterium]
MNMSGRIDRLVKMFLDKRPLKKVNGNGVARILRNKELMKWLLLAGVTKINYRNGKFIDNYGREIVFYMHDGKYNFYVKKGDENER